MEDTNRRFQIYLYALLVLLAIIHLGHGLLRVADPDEFQTLTNAFDAARGLTPYVDYWDNHGPLTIWILQPLLSIWSGGHELIYWLRGVAWLNTLAVASLVFWIARRLHPLRPAAPLISAIFLLSAPPFLSKTIEVRGDNPANLLTTLALGLLIVALQKPRTILFFAVSLCLGTIAGFTLKAIIIATVLTLFYMCWHLREKRLPRLVDVTAIVAGAILPLVAIAGILAVNDSLHPFISCYFGGNVARDSPSITSSEFLEIFKKAPVWSLMATIVIGASLRRGLRGRAAGLEIGFLTMSLFHVAQFLLLLPTKNRQSLLPVFVPLALLTPYAISDFTNSKLLQNRKTVAAIAICLPLLLLRDMTSYSNLKNNGLSKQVEFANQTLSRTTNQKYIFDPSGIVFLKPKPGSFHVLVTFIRQMHQAGTIDLQIPALLNANDVKTIIFDRRAKGLRTADIAYITANYTPTLKGPNCLLLALNTSETTSNTTPPAFPNWTDNAFEDSEQPTKPYNPPNWYRATGY